MAAANGNPAIAPGQSRYACFGTIGVFRVRTTTAPYAGGFVIVDPAP